MHRLDLAAKGPRAHGTESHVCRRGSGDAEYLDERFFVGDLCDKDDRPGLCHECGLKDLATAYVR